MGIESLVGRGLDPDDIEIREWDETARPRDGQGKFGGGGGGFTVADAHRAVTGAGYTMTAQTDRGRGEKSTYYNHSNNTKVAVDEHPDGTTTVRGNDHLGRSVYHPAPAGAKPHPMTTNPQGETTHVHSGLFSKAQMHEAVQRISASASQ